MDFKKLNADASFTGHKGPLGPQGTGFVVNDRLAGEMST